MAVVVLGEDDRERLGGHHACSFSALRRIVAGPCSWTDAARRAASGQGDEERAADARLGFDPDLAAVPLDHPADQGQADPLALGHVRVEPLEGQEQLRWWAAGMPRPLSFT